ncbi:MAG TPA: hypothetical protein VN830_07115 [Verrucomicrobiae bacterium]|nr:hypothetical protein [Verrucomicrobiae bacterium]
MAMNLLVTLRTALVLASLLAAPVWSQQSAHIEEARARPAKPAVKVTPASQKLFGTLGIASKSVEARENLELALDQYENAGFDEAIMHAQMATEKALRRLKYLRTPTAEWYVATQINRINAEGVKP